MDDFPRILIVDDEPPMADSVAAVLLANGYHNISILNDAPAAVAHINSSRYDLVLLDVMMPDMSGFQLLDALDREGMNTIFIVMTGDTSVDTAVEALRRGASDYVRKPCDPDELVIRIRKALNQQNLKNEHSEITTRVESLEMQLAQSQKMEAIGALAGGVAHDFNNILSIIVGNAELASRAIADDHTIHSNLNNIQLASARGKELVNQLLSVGHQADTDWKPLELNSLMAECVTLLRASIPSNVVINHEVSDTAFFIEGDATQIHQIVINLCTNAAHAMEPQGGLLDVTLETVPEVPSSELTSGPYIKLTVSDTGTGIDPQDIGRVFEPYYTTKEIGRGTGMGLSVVHGIVQNHGGDIQVTSKPGVGTQFQVFLPVSNRRQLGTSTEYGDTPSGTEHILLVDDEEMIVDVMEKILTHWGYKVTAFTNSLTAFDAFAEDPDEFNLVITDMMMPGMTGDVLAQKIIEINQELPILLCSGFEENINADRLAEIGIREFIRKPVNLKDLANSVRRILDDESDRRGAKRYNVENGSFVIFKSNPSEPGTLLDVSESGLAVRYEESNHNPELSDELSIISNDGVTVDQIHYESVSDVAENGDVIRRRGIRFDNLTPNQAQQLSIFIESHGKELST